MKNNQKVNNVNVLSSVRPGRSLWRKKKKLCCGSCSLPLTTRGQHETTQELLPHSYLLTASSSLPFGWGLFTSETVLVLGGRGGGGVLGRGGRLGE